MDRRDDPGATFGLVLLMFGWVVDEWKVQVVGG